MIRHNLIKREPIRSQKMRDSAYMENCTFQIPGCCNHGPETVVLCHLPDESHGMGRKSDDVCAAYGCSACHDAIDGRDAQAWITVYEDKEWYMRRAMVRTWRRMIEKGVIRI